ncbi:MAG TPA: molybdenum cofactor guanylyltransferase [Actinomycetota bacterium]|nr:molybdenum cofactor guanylyltransferase [Actinomycetota bacterium]
MCRVGGVATTDDRDNVAGIVLAGGRSRRFGRDKLAEEIDGRPLLHHPVLRLLDVCDRVVVVIGDGIEEPPMPAGVSVTFARDSTADEGPLRGLAAGLEVADTTWAVVAGGDMPDLQPPVLREMLRAARETAAVAVVLSDGGEARPLPCVVRTEPAADAVAILLGSGRRRLRDLPSALRTVVVDEPSWTTLDPGCRTLVDIDEPADVERAPRR